VYRESRAACGTYAPADSPLQLITRSEYDVPLAPPGDGNQSPSDRPLQPVTQRLPRFGRLQLFLAHPKAADLP
jgi:hypothetical protein